MLLALVFRMTRVVSRNVISMGEKLTKKKCDITEEIWQKKFFANKDVYKIYAYNIK